MSLKVIPPRCGKSPNYTIRGSYLGVIVDRSAGTPKKSVADQQLKKLEAAIEVSIRKSPSSGPQRS